MASSADSARMQSFLEEEKKKAMINQTVAKLTNVCWDKCITSTPGSKFSSSETTCLTNCAQRFLDISVWYFSCLGRCRSNKLEDDQTHQGLYYLISLEGRIHQCFENLNAGVKVIKMGGHCGCEFSG